MKKTIICLIMMVLITIISVNALDSKVNNDQYLSLFLTNSTGSNEVVGNLTNHIFNLKPPSNETWILSRLLVTVEDVGGFDANKYGNNIDLTNGIILRTNISGVITNLTNGEPVKTNVDWAKFCYDVNHQDFGIGNEFLNVRWTFSKSGTYIKLNGANNDTIEILVNDDFSGLVSHHFLIQGYKEQTEDDNMKSLAIILGMGLFSFFLMFLSTQFKDKKINKTGESENNTVGQIIKIMILFFSSLIFIVIGNASTKIATTNLTTSTLLFYKLTFYFFNVFVIGISIFIFYFIIVSIAKNYQRRQKGD